MTGLEYIWIIALWAGFLALGIYIGYYLWH